jgi:hypothetical protein
MTNRELDKIYKTIRDKRLSKIRRFYSGGLVPIYLPKSEFLIWLSLN